MKPVRSCSALKRRAVPKIFSKNACAPVAGGDPALVDLVREGVTHRRLPVHQVEHVEGLEDDMRGLGIETDVEFGGNLPRIAVTGNGARP